MDKTIDFKNIDKKILKLIIRGITGENYNSLEEIEDEEDKQKVIQFIKTTVLKKE